MGFAAEGYSDRSSPCGAFSAFATRSALSAGYATATLSSAVASQTPQFDVWCS